VADLSKNPGASRKYFQQYDKMLMFVSLVLLLSSLVYLAVRVGLIRQMQQDFDGELQSYRPRHPHAQPVDPVLFESMTQQLENPPVIVVSGWTNIMLSVPPRRVVCTDSKCLRPVPYEALVCPHCLSEQDVQVVEDDPGRDSSGDGIPDVWLLAHGLDPYTPAARLDADGDGFTNLEEFQADTDPRDPAAHPPLTDKLVVEDVTGTRFGMLYRSRARTADGYRFGLNYLDGNQTATAFVRLGETVSGYIVTNHVERFEQTDSGLKKDVSELTLVRGDHSITLVREQPYQEVELTAHFRFALDNSQPTAKQGEFVTLRGVRYEVIGIDRSSRRVVLQPEPEDSEPVSVGPARQE